MNTRPTQRPSTMLLMAVTTVAMFGLGCRHTPPQAERRIYVISDEAAGVGGAGGHDCAQEQIGCFDRCWNAKERPYPHVKRGEWYYKYCTKKCREEYLECLKGLEKAPKLTFTSMDSALSWLRAHKTELVIGTLVIVAGVAFVITTGGSGALLLAPAAL